MGVLRFKMAENLFKNTDHKRTYPLEKVVKIGIFVVRRLLVDDWLATKILSKFRRMCLVARLVADSIMFCAYKVCSLGCTETSLTKKKK